MSKQPKAKISLPFPVTVIYWKDAYFDNEVHPNESLQAEDQTCPIISVGHLIRETEEVLTIGMDYMESSWRHVQRIRKENVLAVQTLSEATTK